MATLHISRPGSIQTYVQIPRGPESYSVRAEVRVWQHTGKVAQSTTLEPLPSSEVENWAWAKGRFYHPKAEPGGSQKLRGGVRLLFAQPKSSFGFGIPAELLSGRVLEALKLPSCTFASFQQASGIYSSHRYPEGSTPDDCARIGACIL